MDWEHEGKPPLIEGAHFEVWKRSGEVRKVWRPYYGVGYLHYEDCTHPLQNAYCSDDDVLAWRLRDSRTMLINRGA